MKGYDDPTRKHLEAKPSHSKDSSKEMDRALKGSGFKAKEEGSK
ncbi:MAG: hypothetical protein ACLP9D_03505 [Candidatus Bathyarchaeia archaeon]